MNIGRALLWTLLVLDVFLLWRLRNLSREEEAARGRLADLVESAGVRRDAADEARAAARLLERAATEPSWKELDVAAVRDLLIGSERGLDLDRLSLDFRPLEGLAGTGARVQASLAGSFDAIYEYLSRIEALRLPLAPEELSLRSSSRGGVVLTIRFSAHFPGEPSQAVSFSSSEVRRLEEWLSREPPEVPGRSLFAETGSAPEAANASEDSPPPPAPVPEAMEEVVPPPSLEVPELTGFVLARPELEADVSRRVLAAIRFQGELLLVKLGDVVDGYRVERVDARESVLLVNEESGERLTLFLE